MSAAEVRGPRLGDAASLWNFSSSPGWSQEQTQILRLALMYHGVGRWVQILDMGLLPGKLIQQLNGQTQRLLGQQSLAAYTGLHVDVDKIRADNARNKKALRKGGLIIWEGPNPTRQMRAVWQQEAQEKYGLTTEQRADAGAELENIAATTHKESHTILPLVDLLGTSTTDLNKLQKIELLKRLLHNLQSLCCSLEDPGLAVTADLLEREADGDGQVGQNLQKRQPVRRKKAAKPKQRLPKPPLRRSKRPRQETGEFEDKWSDSEDEHGGAGRDMDGILAAKQASRMADVDQLQAMGFSKSDVLEAMEECSDNLDQALDWLVSNVV